MARICFTFNNVKHCIDIPLLVDREHLHRPPPPNFPELDLALSVLELVDFLKPQLKDSELSRSLTDVSTRFIQQVQRQLPTGVEITGVSAKAA